MDAKAEDMFRVEIIRAVLQKFLEDWQSRPYKWAWEIDIQSEIASRLRLVLELMGRNSVLAYYANVLRGFEGNQVWSRVCCEPEVRCGESFCKPDIAVLDDIPDPSHPPDRDKEGSFPNLWLCEIKRNPYPRGAEAKDVAKLRKLLEQGRTRYACSLTLYDRRAQSGGGIAWEAMDQGRLWQWTAELPAFGTTSWLAAW